MQKQFRAPKDADVNELLLQVGCNGQPQDLRDNISTIVKGDLFHVQPIQTL
jgi:hypothetical protein